MQNYNKFLGYLGQKFAKEFLQEKKFEILEQNFQIWGGEIDLICRDIKSDEVVFIEVKTRTNTFWQDIDEALNSSQKRFDAAYKRVKAWIKIAKNELDDELLREYARYLLPHAHAARYRMYGSVDDWQYVVGLRTRNGGHIAYRDLSYTWLEDLAKETPLFKSLLAKLPKVDPKSREQFFDRS